MNCNISIRIDADLKDTLQRMADSDHRFLSDFIRLKLKNIAAEFISSKSEEEERLFALREEKIKKIASNLKNL